MQMTSAMLADAAQVQGGKLYVLGGGFDTILTRSLPAVQRGLALVMVASVDPSERHQDLELFISLLDEDGKAIGLQAKGRVGKIGLASGENLLPTEEVLAAVDAARGKGRDALFQVLYAVAPVLAAEDHGRVLLAMVEAIVEVEGWWG